MQPEKWQLEEGVIKLKLCEYVLQTRTLEHIKILNVSYKNQGARDLSSLKVSTEKSSFCID